MDKTKKVGIIASAAALVAGCAAFGTASTDFNPPPLGSTWQMSQKNTGSYGKDAEVVITHAADGTWQGNKVYKISLSNGATIQALPTGKWMAITGKEDKPLFTYDPPIGYDFPLQVGKTWKTHHKVTNHMAGSTAEIDYSCKIESRESVSVPAGAFDAFKIVCENEFSREVTWFSTDIGVNVKGDMQRKAAYPGGEGRQQSQLVALKLAK